MKKHVIELSQIELFIGYGYAVYVDVLCDDNIVATKEIYYGFEVAELLAGFVEGPRFLVDANDLESLFSISDAVMHEYTAISKDGVLYRNIRYKTKCGKDEYILARKQPTPIKYQKTHERCDCSLAVGSKSQYQAEVYVYEDTDSVSYDEAVLLNTIPSEIDMSVVDIDTITDDEADSLFCLGSEPKKLSRFERAFRRDADIGDLANYLVWEVLGSNSTRWGNVPYYRLVIAKDSVKNEFRLREIAYAMNSLYRLKHKVTGCSVGCTRDCLVCGIGFDTLRTDGEPSKTGNNGEDSSLYFIKPEPAFVKLDSDVYMEVRSKQSLSVWLERRKYRPRSRMQYVFV